MMNVFGNICRRFGPVAAPEAEAEAAPEAMEPVAARADDAEEENIEN